MRNETQNTTHGSGQSVQIIVGEGLGRWIFAAVIVLVLMVTFVTNRATSAAADAASARRAADLAGVNNEYNTQAILIWMREAKSAADGTGVKLPPLPTLKTNGTAN